jgi:hypothetical protein
MLTIPRLSTFCTGGSVHSISKYLEFNGPFYYYIYYGDFKASFYFYWDIVYMFLHIAIYYNIYDLDILYWGECTCFCTGITLYIIYDITFDILTNTKRQQRAECSVFVCQCWKWYSCNVMRVNSTLWSYTATHRFMQALINIALPFWKYSLIDFKECHMQEFTLQPEIHNFRSKARFRLKISFCDRIYKLCLASRLFFFCIIK